MVTNISLFRKFLGKDLKRKQEWVFGLYDRDTQKALFLHVPNRNATTLLNLINKHCLPKSVIYSDCWAAYNRISDINNSKFKHRTVNHNYTFVDRGVHTNSVESIWNSGKIYTKQMRGISRKYLQSYLDEFCWRRNNNLTRFEAFDAIIRAIGKVFPAGSDPNLQ